MFSFNYPSNFEILKTKIDKNLQLLKIDKNDELIILNYDNRFNEIFLQYSNNCKFFNYNKTEKQIEIQNLSEFTGYIFYFGKKERISPESLHIFYNKLCKEAKGINFIIPYINRLGKCSNYELIKSSIFTLKQKEPDCKDEENPCSYEHDYMDFIYYKTLSYFEDKDMKMIEDYIINQNECNSLTRQNNKLNIKYIIDKNNFNIKSLSQVFHNNTHECFIFEINKVIKEKLYDRVELEKKTNCIHIRKSVPSSDDEKRIKLIEKNITEQEKFSIYYQILKEKLSSNIFNIIMLKFIQSVSYAKLL